MDEREMMAREWNKYSELFKNVCVPAVLLTGGNRAGTKKANRLVQTQD